MDFFHTTITEEAIARVTQVLRSTFVNEGDAVREFEARLRAFTGAPHMVTVNSGTSALHLVLVMLGIKPGDEVIVPPQTFVATGLVVLHCRATPVFADIDPTTANIDPDSVAAHITDRTRAVIAVHWGGMPCDMKALQKICAARDITLIEDAAHAFGASYCDRAIGTWSRFTCFSFQAIKGLTTGDGGAVGCLNDDDAADATRRRWFGIDKRQVQKNDIGERIVSLDTVGYKYHMNNIAAAIGLGNLESLAARLRRRREIAERYQATLAQLPGLRLLRTIAGAQSSCWLFGVRVERRNDFGRAMHSRGVPVSVIDRRIDRHPVFGGLRDDLPGIAIFDEEHIAIPSHEGLTDAEVSQVIAAVREGW
jgi:perosamine synthetase